MQGIAQSAPIAIDDGVQAIPRRKLVMVGADASKQLIVAAIADQRVAAIAATQHIDAMKRRIEIAQVAIQNIVAGTAVEKVIPSQADQGVCTAFPIELVVAVVGQIAGQDHTMVSFEPVVVITTEQVITTPVSDQRIVATFSIEPISAMEGRRQGWRSVRVDSRDITVQTVITLAPKDDVVARLSPGIVIPTSRINVVIPDARHIVDEGRDVSLVVDRDPLVVVVGDRKMFIWQIRLPISIDEVVAAPRIEVIVALAAKQAVESAAAKDCVIAGLRGDEVPLLAQRAAEDQATETALYRR